MPTIPDLPALVVVAGSELLPVDDGSTTSSATADELLVRPGGTLHTGTDVSWMEFQPDGSWEITRGAGGRFRFDVTSGQVNMTLPPGCSFQVQPLSGPILIELRSDGSTAISLQGGFFHVAASLALSLYEAPAGLGVIVHRLPVYDDIHGGLLGYLPIYDHV